MGKKDKLIKRLKSRPKDFTFDEAETLLNEYYVAAEPPVRCGESHHSGQTEPPYY